MWTPDWACRKCQKLITGSRAEHCLVCHETFTSTTAGDMHRVGKHGVTAGPDRRRCLTATEMLDKGMTKNGRGYWTSGAADWNPRETFPQSRPTT